MTDAWATIRPYIDQLSTLLEDDQVSEILCNPSGEVFIEMGGILSPMPVIHIPQRELEAGVKRIARELGKDISSTQPLLEAKLPNGSRVAAVFPPCSVGGITFSIRKFQFRRFDVEQLLRCGSLTMDQLAKLLAAIDGRKNVLISGGTGAGKTTLLNALASLIPDDQRIVLIEDVNEIQIDKPNVVRLEARPEQPNMPAVTITDLLRMSLRLRPDRLIVGEVRGGEAFELLQALNSGHSGSFSTIHADNTQKAIERLTGCVLQRVPAMDPKYIKEHWILPSIQVFVHLSRAVDGKRYISGITETKQ